MALSTFSVACKQASDAEFRAWGSALNTALAAVGLVQTADTGQINWTTVTYPTVANTYKGYEIWTFNDTLQASAPVFIRIEYGAGAAATSPAILLTVGVATDGAGTLTGVKTTAYQVKTATNSATAYTCRVSGATNRVVVAMWESAGNASYALFFAVERTHDADGDDNDEGAVVLTHYTAAPTSRVLIFASGEVGVETTWGALVPSTGTGASGANIAIYPVFSTKGTFLNPSSQLLIHFAANITAGTPISFTYYGSTKEFMPLNQTTYVAVVRGSIAGLAFLMRND